MSGGLAKMINLETLRELDCAASAARAAGRIRNAKFPVNYSIQSVKLRPVEQVSKSKRNYSL